MLSNNNSTCRFQEEIVSYLYDEASVPENAAFVAHLTNCASCADELTAFGFVRSSIQEWRTEEICSLDMPALEIPALKTAKIEQKTLISNESNSWLETLKRLFALSPRLAFGSIAFIALAACVGLIFVIANFSSNKNIAGKENQASEQILASNNNTKIEEKISTPKDEKNYASQPAPENQEKAENKFPEKQPLVKKESIVKTSAASKNKSSAPKSNNTFAVSDKNNKNRNDKIQKQEIPTLSNFDDDDDKSLRLADLFSEIGTE
ncbi:MAG TPA: zf-HC2 domain-containing protein [Pyrinomonadaceae bacterium]|jgi:hypothetical protein